jgi:ketosteroid isomerase-like protein
MKKSILLIFAIVLFGFISSCTTESQPQQSAQEKEQAVASAVENFKTGLINADRDLLENLTSDELVFVHSSGKMQNKAEFIEEIVSLNPNDYTNINLEDQKISVEGNTAVVTHIYHADYTSNEVPGSVRIGIMLIWHETDGEWKLLARQAYRLPEAI